MSENINPRVSIFEKGRLVSSSKLTKEQISIIKKNNKGGSREKRK